MMTTMKAHFIATVACLFIAACNGGSDGDDGADSAGKTGDVSTTETTGEFVAFGK